MPDKDEWDKLTGPMKLFIKTNLGESYSKALVLEGIKGANNNWPKDEAGSVIVSSSKITFIVKKSGLSFAEWNGINAAPERKFLLQNCSGNESLMGKLAQAAKAGIWPKDDADQSLDDLAKLKFISNKTGLAYAEWNALDKTPDRQFLLTNCSTDASLMGVLSPRLPKQGTWPKDAADAKASG